MTPSERRDDDQGEDDRELRPVGAEEREDPAQVRLPHRGVGGALGELLVSALNRRPGICLECLRQPGPGRATVLRFRAPRPPPAAGRSAPARPPRSALLARRRSARRSARQAAGSRTSLARAPSASRAVAPAGAARPPRAPSVRRPAATALLAARLPRGRCRRPALPRAPPRPTRSRRYRSATAHRDRLDAVEPGAEERHAPELRLGEVAHRARDRRGEHERVEHRLVVAGDDERPGGRHVLLAPNLEPVERANHRCQRPAVGLVAHALTVSASRPSRRSRRGAPRRRPPTPSPAAGARARRSGA